MVSEFPSNSRSKQVKPEPAAPKETVEKVVVGEVIRKKKGLGRRFKETFMGGNANGAGSFVFYDILLPAARNMIADAVSQGAEKMIFGEARSRSRGASRYDAPGHTQYNNVRGSVLGSRPDPRSAQRRGRAQHNFDDIIIGTRAEALEILGRLDDAVKKYESVSVAYLYEMLDVPATYVDQKYGWFDLPGADVHRVREGYLLDLPKPEPLD